MKEKRNIIVIGASAGGLQALKSLLSEVPADLPAAIFIVWHMSPEMQGILPQVINKLGRLPAAHALDKEPIALQRIYVAPPDHHLLIEEGCVRLGHGPKENRFRPAVDPLFRSAAFAYGPRVIGIVLSGGLDDGSAGLWTIKSRGGLAVVQDPADAEVSSMPANALKAVEADHRLPVKAIGPLLVQLVQEEVETIQIPDMPEQDKTRKEVNIAVGDNALANNLQEYSAFSPYTCPECHGVLSALKDGNLVRFRCHTGHAFSSDNLLAALTEAIEMSLYNALRNMQESVLLLNHLGDHLAEANAPRLAAQYFQKALEAAARADLVRQALLSHEPLTTEAIEASGEREQDSVHK